MLHTLVFVLPLVEHPASGLFSFSGVAVLATLSALVALSVAPLCALLSGGGGYNGRRYHSHILD